MQILPTNGVAEKIYCLYDIVLSTLPIRKARFPRPGFSIYEGISVPPPGGGMLILVVGTLHACKPCFSLLSLKKLGGEESKVFKTFSTFPSSVPSLIYRNGSPKGGSEAKKERMKNLIQEAMEKHAYQRFGNSSQRPRQFGTRQ